MRFGVFKGDDDYYFYTTLYIYVRDVECLLGKKENHKEDHLACDECYPALKEKITDIYQSYCNKDNDFKNFDNPFCFDDTKKEISIHFSKYWGGDELMLAYIFQNSCDNNSNQEQSEALRDYNDAYDDANHKTVGSLMKAFLYHTNYRMREIQLNKNIFRFMNDILKITGYKFEHRLSWSYDCSCDINQEEFDLAFSYNNEGEFPKSTLKNHEWMDCHCE